MSRFDLANPADFAKITLTDASQAAQALKALVGENEWLIQEGSYQASDSATPVLFHVFESKTEYNAALPSITDAGGRRKVKYNYPYRDGQTTNDLGRKALVFNIDVVFHGTNYLEAFKRVLNEMDRPTPGKLVHPVMGTFQCVMEDYSITHSSEQRRALTARFVMTEHNYDIGSLRDLGEIKTFKKTLTDATTAFSFLDDVISAVNNALNLPQLLKNSLIESIRIYSDQYGKILTKLNALFNSGGSSNDIPNLRPTNSEGGTSGGDTFPVTAPSDPISDVPDTVVSPITITAVAVEDVQKDIAINRDALAKLILDLSNTNQGQGALDFYDQITNLRQILILQQNTFEAGVQSSKARIVEYTVPREMSIREVAFLNGISLDTIIDIDTLNPQLESVNLIPQGTVMKIPVA